MASADAAAHDKSGAQKSGNSPSSSAAPTSKAEELDAELRRFSHSENY